MQSKFLKILLIITIVCAVIAVTVSLIINFLPWLSRQKSDSTLNQNANRPEKIAVPDEPAPQRLPAELP